MVGLQVLVDNVQVNAVHRPVAFGAPIGARVASRPVVSRLDVVALRTLVAPATPDLINAIGVLTVAVAVDVAHDSNTSRSRSLNTGSVISSVEIVFSTP